MDRKGSSRAGQEGEADSVRDGQGGLTYAKRGLGARSEYPAHRGEGSAGSGPGSGFGNGSSPGGPQRQRSVGGGREDGDQAARGPEVGKSLKAKKVVSKYEQEMTRLEAKDRSYLENMDDEAGQDFQARFEKEEEALREETRDVYGEDLYGGSSTKDRGGRKNKNVKRRGHHQEADTTAYGSHNQYERGENGDTTQAKLLRGSDEDEYYDDYGRKARPPPRRPRQQISRTKSMKSRIEYEEEEALDADELPTYSRQASRYNNMIVCHAIASGDELTSVKFLAKASLNAVDFPDDEIPKRLIRLFAGKPFAEARSQLHTRELRAALNEALAFAIEAKREVVAFDLAEFTRSRGSQLTIGEAELQRLIRGEMYQLIQTLISSNSFYQVDERFLNVDDIFAAQQIKDRALPNATDIDTGGQALKTDEDEYEGGDGDNNANADLPVENEGPTIEAVTEEKSPERERRRRKKKRSSSRKPKEPIEGEQPENVMDTQKSEAPGAMSGAGSGNENIEAALKQFDENEKSKLERAQELQNLDRELFESEYLKPESDFRRAVSNANGDNNGIKTFATESGLPAVSEIPNEKGEKETPGEDIAAGSVQETQAPNESANEPQGKTPSQGDQSGPIAQPKLIEKYLQISDFISYIIDNKDLFLEEELMNIKTKPEEKKVVMGMIIKFMLETQNSVDYDKVIRLLIENDLISILIDELFEQTDAAIKSAQADDDAAREGTVVPVPEKETKEDAEIFGRTPRLRLITQIINQSVDMRLYNYAYEITRRFMSDLLKAKYLPIFELLFNHFQQDTTRYEAKLAIMLTVMPLMNRRIAAKFMKIIEVVLNEPASNSILRNNNNFLRVGLMLYRVLVEIQKEYAYSENSTQLMLDTIAEQLRSALEIYNDPDEVMILVDQTDYEGNDIFWYLDEYDMYSILDCRIMDRVIQKKWAGKFDLNSSVLDYSTSYTVLQDRHQLFATDRVFSEIKFEMLTLDRSERTHQYKFFVWQNSMFLRFLVEAAFVVIQTLIFQYSMNGFSGSFLKAKAKFVSGDITDLERIEAYNNLDSAASALDLAIYMSFFNLIWPFNTFLQWYFTRQTKRKAAEIDLAEIIEIALFVSTLIWIIYWQNLYGVENWEDNNYYSPDMTKDQIYVINIMWSLQVTPIGFQFILASVAFFTWLKLLFRLRVTFQFGPMFKMIGAMINDLAQFIIIWSIILILFVSSSSLVFQDIHPYSSFVDNLVFHFEAALGNWDARATCRDDQKQFISTLSQKEQDHISFMCELGRLYTVINLLIQSVLFLNFVIAILGSTYGRYEEVQVGLYYEVLVALFPRLEWDDLYGAIVCAQPPTNMIVAPFQWVVVLPLSESFLRQYNQFLCHIAYFPLAVVFTTYFSVVNLLYVPIAYVRHLLALINTLTDSDETMDEFDEKLERFYTIVKYFFLGPFLHLSSIPIDSFVFLYNLYTKPAESEEMDIELISKNALDQFSLAIDETLREQRKIHGRMADTKVEFVELNKKLQLKLNILSKVRSLIFDNYDDTKFIHDPVSNAQKISPKYMRGINEFVELKKLVANSADSTGYVDTELLRSLVQSCELRVSMLAIEVRVGGLDSDKSTDETFKDALFELSKTAPSAVEGQLAEDTQILEVLDEKLNTVTSAVNTLSTDVMSKLECLQADMDAMKAQMGIKPKETEE